MSPKLLNILLVLTIVILYYGYLNPMYTGQAGLVWTPESSIGALQAQNIQYINTFNQIDFVKHGAELLNKDYLAIDDETKKKVNKMLPNSIDPLKLRDEVISVSNRTGVPLVGLSIEPYTGLGIPGGMGAYRISFNMNMKYSAFKEFMTEYQKSIRVFSISTLAVTRRTSTEYDKDLSLEDNQEILDFSVVTRVLFLR